jgi:predicted membrane protein DUF2142
MNPASSPRPASLVLRHERKIVGLLCLVAAARVFIFSAAFPFFNNVDEDLHFDLVMRYSHGQPPRGYDLLTKESITTIALYASPEFLFPPQYFPEGKIPTPLWKQSATEASPALRATEDLWKKEINFESSQPPLYYAIAALWLRIGQQIGLTGPQLLYWIRFLNLPLVAGLVWLGFVTARTLFPDAPSLRLGVPLLLAFIPQDIFYSIQNDALSPICLGGVFICLARWLRDDSASIWLGTLTGLSIAAAYLTKITNLPMLSVALIGMITLCHHCRRKPLRRQLAALGTMFLCAAVPIGSWMIWSKHVFGDVTGSATKSALLGWSRKTLPEWWHHPIFSPTGFWAFLSEIIASFWRGEITWAHQTLHSQPADLFYIGSSLLFLILALTGARRDTGFQSFQRKAIWGAALILFVSVGSLAILSLQFDFGKGPYPSRAFPYFASGRLLSGALIPFAVLYVYGLERLLRRLHGERLLLLVLAIMLALVTTSEVIVNRVAFSSEHNWFHL